MPRKPPPLQRGKTPWNKGKRWRLKKNRKHPAPSAPRPPPMKPRVRLAMTNPYNVRPGQVWENKDPRAGKSSKAGAALIQVVKVAPPHALCNRLDQPGVVTKIRLDMFREKEARATRVSNAGWRLKEGA